MKIDAVLTVREQEFLKALANKKYFPDKISEAVCDQPFKTEWAEEIKEFKKYGLLEIGNVISGGEFELYYFQLNPLGEIIRNKLFQMD